MDQIIDTVGSKAQEVLELFEIDPGDIKPFSRIMQEANEELGRLNFSYEQVVYDLKQAKQSAEQLAIELKQANDRLQLEITERLRVEEELRQYAETQEVLVREVNHRVKNNLTAIISMLHMEEDLAESEAQSAYLPSLRDLVGRRRCARQATHARRGRQSERLDGRRRAVLRGPAAARVASPRWARDWNG